jgi:hypothetical protein
LHCRRRMSPFGPASFLSSVVLRGVCLTLCGLTHAWKRHVYSVVNMLSQTLQSSRIWFGIVRGARSSMIRLRTYCRCSLYTLPNFASLAGCGALAQIESGGDTPLLLFGFLLNLLGGGISLELFGSRLQDVIETT